MLKIAVLNIYNGLVERGAEVFVSEIAEKLSDKCNVDVFQIGENREKRYQTVIIKSIPKTPFLYHLWVWLFTLKCLPYLWKNKYDFIIPVNGRMQVVLCRFFRFLRGGKILISGHSGVGVDDKFNLLFGKPDIFIALTPSAFDWANKFNSKSLIKYIPNGVDTGKFRTGIKKIDLKLKPPVVLCVSALEEYKRVDKLILAVEKLKETSLLVVGNGPLKEKVESLGREKLGSRFQLIEYIPNDKMPQIYNSAQVFSLPSKEFEAFGLVYLEALACNIPVVVPDDRNRRELIGDAGEYCNIEDANEYAQTIERAIIKNYGEKPRKKSLNYSWETAAGKYYQLMTENNDRH